MQACAAFNYKKKKHSHTHKETKRTTRKRTVTGRRVPLENRGAQTEDDVSVVRARGGVRGGIQASGRGHLAFQIMHLQLSLRHIVNAALERSHPRAKTLSSALRSEGE